MKNSKSFSHRFCRHMINIVHRAKMLRFVIFSLFIAAINAAGEFSVLNSPKSISFKGKEPLQSQFVSDVLYAAMGNAIAGDATWGGMNVNDPFNLAKGVIAVYADGVNHISTTGNAKTYELVGSETIDALNAVSSQLEANNEPVCDIDFSHFEDGVVTFKAWFGEIEAPAAKATKHLNPTLHSSDKQFLQEIGYINAAAENLANMVKPSNFLVIRTSLENIGRAHGEKSDALAEANKLLSAAIGRLLAAAQKSMDSVLFVQLTNKNVAGRTKREVLPTSSSNTLNLAEYYSEDYPVIFNIILWFMVVFGLSLLAICYAIGSMDPGRDSIIYRMTSTRMKKDN